MKKFIKEIKEELKIDRKIPRKEKRKAIVHAKDDFQKSRSWTRKLSRANKRIGSLEGELKRELGIIRTRLKMTSKQLKILTKKEKFLLGEISSLKKHENENKGQIKVGKKDSKRLAREAK